MIVALPLCVARIVDLCATGDPRYASTTGVQVTDNGDGTFTLAATDGRFLGICRGKMPPDLPCWEDDVAGQDAANAVKQVVVPAKEWKAIFSGKDGDYVTVWSDGEMVNLRRWDKNKLRRTIAANSVDGRFPPWQSVMPQGLPTAAVMVDCQKLGRALDAANAIATTVEHGAMRMGFYPFGKDSVIGFSGHRVDPEVAFDGLVVPLAFEKAAEAVDVANQEDEAQGVAVYDDSEEDFVDQGADPDAYALDDLGDNVDVPNRITEEEEPQPTTTAAVPKPSDNGDHVKAERGIDDPPGPSWR